MVFDGVEDATMWAVLINCGYQVTQKLEIIVALKKTACCDLDSTYRRKMKGLKRILFWLRANSGVPNYCRAW